MDAVRFMEEKEKRSNQIQEMEVICKICGHAIANMPPSKIYDTRLRHFQKHHPEEYNKLIDALKGQQNYMGLAIEYGLWLRI